MPSVYLVLMFCALAWAFKLPLSKQVQTAIWCLRSIKVKNVN